MQDNIEQLQHDIDKRAAEILFEGERFAAAVRDLREHRQARRKAAAKAKPLSAARAREFKGRALRKVFGPREARAKRWAYLVREVGEANALALSRTRPPYDTGL